MPGPPIPAAPSSAISSTSATDQTTSTTGPRAGSTSASFPSPSRPLLYYCCVRQTARRRPRKALGQHWLVDRHALNRIAAAADFGDEDTVVEIGAGKGALTQLLARRARRLIAVEVDPALAEGLRARFSDAPQVSVVEADVLSLPPEHTLHPPRAP